MNDDAVKIEKFKEELKNYLKTHVFFNLQNDEDICFEGIDAFFELYKYNIFKCKIMVSEFGCSSPVSFITTKGIKRLDPGKIYDENLDEKIKD